MRRFLIVAVFMALLPMAFAQKAGKVACDRACLEKYVDQYMDAMLAHDPSPTLFAKNCIFTENGVRLPLGNEGLWFDMAGKGTYKFYIPDIETQQIAFIGTAKEGGSAPRAKTLQTELTAKLAASEPSAKAAAKPGAKPPEPTTVAIALRLKIVKGLITEAEQLVIRPETSLMGGTASKFPPTGEAVEKMGAPHEDIHDSHSGGGTGFPRRADQGRQLLLHRTAAQRRQRPLSLYR